MGARKGAAPSGAATGQQRQLSVRDRQFIAAIRREAAAIEKETPGAIHALHFDSSGKKSVHGWVVFNRHRGGSGQSEVGARRRHLRSVEATGPAGSAAEGHLTRRG